MKNIVEAFAWRYEKQKQRRCEGLDVNVVYLTTRDVMRHTGLGMSSMQHHIRDGHIAPARSCGFKEKKLFHPDEVKRFRIEHLKQEVQ